MYGVSLPKYAMFDMGMLMQSQVPRCPRPFCNERWLQPGYMHWIGDRYLSLISGRDRLSILGVDEAVHIYIHPQDSSFEEEQLKPYSPANTADVNPYI